MRLGGNRYKILAPWLMLYCSVHVFVAGVREERVSQSKCVKIIYLRVIPGWENIAPERDYGGGRWGQF